MDAPSSKIAAKKLIERIRLEHSPPDSSKLSSIIRGSLDILSAEIYDTSTHFVQEFLQNADDNDYDPGVVPKLQFSYHPGFLRVDCNEVGFTANNVEAICTIRSSTKGGPNHADRTGEKGIGFKSVFKIADVVWIYSREYAFKFDKRTDFGVIAPIWDDFPRPVLEGHTSYLLQLDKSFDGCDVLHRLQDFDHTSLLFLRRLRHVTLNVALSGSVQTVEIRRRDEFDDNGPVTIIEMGQTKFTYITVKAEVNNLPREVKRTGSQSSELVLAFPVPAVAEDIAGAGSKEHPKKIPQQFAESEPENRRRSILGKAEVTPNQASEAPFLDKVSFTQKVYAILPIAQFGLKFIVQGDFILTANRRQIDTSSPWNVALRNALPGAFLTSINRLNSGHMRFLWPAFIPSAEIDPFLEPARREIVERLKELRILESATGEMTSPSKLTYLDEGFLDHLGEPLCLSKHTRSTYLSRNYGRHLKVIFHSLGVEQLPRKKFVEQLEQMILEDEERFHDKSDEWHSELARALLPLIEDDGLKEALRRLPMVPLSNGQWVAAASEPRTFQEESELSDLHVLESLRVVHPAAMKNANRRSLWSFLDIQPISRQNICQYIVDAHDNPMVDPDVWTRSQLIAHAKFLYSSKWRPSRPIDLWVETSHGRRIRSSEVYCLDVSVRDEPTRRVFDEMRNWFGNLHHEYFLSTTAASNVVGEKTEAFEDPNTTFTETFSAKRVHYLDDSAESVSSKRLRRLGDSTKSGTSKQIHYLEDMADIQSTACPMPEDMFQQFLHSRTLRREWDHVLQREKRYEKNIASKDEDECTSYLKDVLQVASLPRMAKLSPWEDYGSLESHPDISRLFKLCNASDVLHVLVSNWHHYAHLIEFQGVGDQGEQKTLQDLIRAVWHWDDEAMSPGETVPEGSNEILLGQLANVSVKTNVGEVRLWSCVLPNLDPRFDEDPDIRLPTVDLKDCCSNVLHRLKHLMISVEADIHFYLKCLEALRRKSAPPHDTLKRLYEEVQLRYDEHADVITRAFNRFSLVYQSKRSFKDGLDHGSWMTIDEFMEAGFNPASEYPTCKHLFYSLCDPTSLQIAELITIVSSAEAHQPAEVILGDLARLSHHLKAMEPRKAAERVKKLKERNIFPVWDTMSALNEGRFDRLVSPNDHHWYIDDTCEFRDSFGGKIPLLAAFPVSILQITYLLAALTLDSRRLSEAISRRFSPTGRQRFLAETTMFLRSRHCFFQPLIPKDHSAGRANVLAQFRNISASSVTGIMQMFDLVTGQIHVTGKGPPVQASIRPSKDSLQLFCTESDLDSLATTLQWVNLLAQHMEIDDQISRDLLFAVLTNPNHNHVYHQFQSFGHRVEYAASAYQGNTDSRYNSLSGNVPPISLASDPWDSTLPDPWSSLEGKAGPQSEKIQPPSRRIPLLNLIHNSTIGSSGFFDQGYLPKDPFPEFRPFLVQKDPNSHDQYIAESMVSQLFHDRLGELYDPIKCWTSSLRSRSGLPVYESDGTASFTMIGRDLSKAMWKLLLQSSYRYAAPFSRKRFSIDTAYHCEVFMTDGDSTDWFSLNATRLDRARSYSYIPSHQDKGTPLSDLVVWVRIYYGFTNPRFEFIADPWLYFIRGGMAIRDFDGAQISLMDNQAEDSSLKRTRLRIDDLRLDINRLGPSLSELNSRRGGSITFKEDFASNSRDATAQDLPEYRYADLSPKNIRLFILFRGEYDDVLRGAICHMPFDDTGAFKALSYVWGPEQPYNEKHILFTTQGVLRIQSSLAAALKRVRQHTKDLVFWVDAICINQQDDIEKAEQISLLPQMFQRATCTLAVLATDEKSDETVRNFLIIAAVKECGSSGLSPEWMQKLGLLETRPRFKSGPDGVPPKHSTFWQEVTYFFRRPWFRRAWIVQEAIAARTVTLMCGQWTFDWNVLRSAMEVVEQRFRTTALADAWQPFMKLTEHREYEVRQKRWPLLDLLERFPYVKAGRRRDRFFSLLGLSTDADNPLFEPDYRSPFESIVRRFAQAFVEQGDGMRLLCFAGLGHAGQGTEVQQRSLPSWMPDWTRQANRPRSLSSAVSRGVSFSASGWLGYSMHYDPVGDVLEVAGTTLERIMLVSLFCNEPSQRRRYFQELDAMIASCELIDPERHQHLKESVPVAGALYPDTVVSNPSGVTESYSAFRKWLDEDHLRDIRVQGIGKGKEKERVSGGIESVSGERPVHDPTMMWEGFQINPRGDVVDGENKHEMYAALLDEYVFGWKFVITETGRCGIAPNGVLPGDVVTILSGGNVPFLLREGFGPAFGFCLVGECYIDGLMLGEAVRRFEHETVIPELIELQ